jgi:trimeric autotransporter adhesin
MYDVNFGGKEHMTKRFTIALVALALFVLIAVMPVSAAYYTVATNVSGPSATVFIGEQGLNLTALQNTVDYTPAASTHYMPYPDSIGWWASAAVIGTTAPTKTVSLVGRNQSFSVAPADFVGYTGNWYESNGTIQASPKLFFTVADPTLDVKIWDYTQAADVTGKSIPQGEALGFRIDTNMYAAVNNPTGRFPVVASSQNLVQGQTFGAVNDGYLDIKVKDESGTTLNALVNGSYNGAGTVYAIPLTRQNVSFQPWFWGTAPSTFNPAFQAQVDAGATSMGYTNWSTGALDTNGQYAYPPGTYTVTVESKLNAMLDNYKNAGADYTGKTVSQSYTVTLVSDTVKIEANKDSVVRSKPFSITVTGKPTTMYHLWVKGTSSMDGGYDNQPPMVKLYQTGVAQDAYIAAPGGNGIDAFAPGLAGNYTYQNGGGDNVWNDVAKGGTAAQRAVLGNGTYCYANITTSSSGTRTVEFTTTNWTKAQKYTIRVEQNFGGQYKSDEVDVKVEKGAVTIVAAGDQSYYLGEEIKFSGTNTETYQTYLFIVGPNLPSQGAEIQGSNPRADGAPGVTNGAPNTFQIAQVQGDNTWSWKWGTSKVALDAGTYTIYAVSQPKDKNNLEQAAYGTVSIIIKKPFVSATASQSTVAQGDKLFITGTAEGQPKAIQIWILGKNYAVKATEAVNSDASFKYEVRQESTRNLYPGQYFVVVQHPMQNNVFDIDTCTAANAGTLVNPGNYVCNLQQAKGTAGAQNIFTLLGASSLQGSDAAEALVQGINTPNVDDTYTKLQFLVEVPVIRVDPIGDKHVGDKFTITAQTNLAVDDEILVQVYSSSFKPTQKSQSGEFSGATGTVKVTKGDAGMNKISFDVDSSTFKPDEYIVTESAVIQTATGTALFNVLEGVPPTAVPTVVVTTAAPTAVPTTVVTTAAPTPVPTTKSPGYGALIALIGLGAVAFIVVRRH